MTDKPKTFAEWYSVYSDFKDYEEGMKDAFDAGRDARDADFAEKDRRIAELEGQLQRATDLVRFARHFLHNENCISDEEYAAIVVDSDGRVARLEGYDKVRAALEARIAELEDVLKDLLSAHHHSRGDEYVDAAYAALKGES